MNERALRVLGAALAAAGAGIAAYLLYVRQTGTVLACATGGCETVQSSDYAELLGVPVAGLGLTTYLVLLGAAVARGELARTIGAVVAVAGVLFSGYLLYVQLDLIGAVCDWCLASDALMSGVAVLALLRLRAAERETVGL
jgi:uncharacterized membrane protein